MSLIPKIAGAILTFFLFCSLIGRPDIPMKMLLKLQVETFKVIDADWGDPNVFK